MGSTETKVIEDESPSGREKSRVVGRVNDDLSAQNWVRRVEMEDSACFRAACVRYVDWIFSAAATCSGVGFGEGGVAGGTEDARLVARGGDWVLMGLRDGVARVFGGDAVRARAEGRL